MKSFIPQSPRLTSREHKGEFLVDSCRRDVLLPARAPTGCPQVTVSVRVPELGLCLTPGHFTELPQCSSESPWDIK